MSYYIFRTMIVPRDKVVQAREIAVALAPTGGSGMWTTGLSPTGENPATYFISTGAVGEEFAGCLSDANTLLAACETVEYVVTLQELEDLLAACDVTEEPPFDAMARLGLTLINDVAE
jgi:hypothetical protein